MTRLEVLHETRYDYGAPVTLAHHLAHLRPLDDAHQSVQAWSLAIEPAVDHRREAPDAEGNATCWFTLARAHEALAVTGRSVVEVRSRFDDLDADASPPWDRVAAGLRYVSRRPYEPAVAYVQPSPYVPRLPALRDWAAPSLVPGRPLARVALELMQRVHDEFTYETASTHVDTPLAQVLERRRGVCQDFAHVLAGALRMHGLPVRYVSGYLLTATGADAPVMVGADASHAWVQAWCPHTPGVPGAWLDLDPTNRMVPGEGHVRVAVGRDFGDVTPLRGVIRGGGQHRLAVGVTTRMLSERPT